VKDKGGTMRLGAYPCRLKAGSLAAKIYGKTLISERHRHRYEFNTRYLNACGKKGLLVSGLYREKRLPEIVELKGHPWFVGVQFHPELKSRPLTPHPLFSDFVAAAIKSEAGRGTRATGSAPDTSAKAVVL